MAMGHTFSIPCLYPKMVYIEKLTFLRNFGDLELSGLE